MTVHPGNVEDEPRYVQMEAKYYGECAGDSIYWDTKYTAEAPQ